MTKNQGFLNFFSHWGVKDFIPSEIWFHFLLILEHSPLLCFSSKKRHVHTSCQHAKGNEFIHEMLEEERNMVGLLYNSYILSISTNSATFWTPERFLEVFPKKNPQQLFFFWKLDLKTHFRNNNCKFYILFWPLTLKE